MTIKAYVNKILKQQGQKPLTKSTNIIGDGYLKLAFESISKRVLKLKKDKSLSKDEADILLLAIERAIKYGPLLDKYDYIDLRILDAREELKDGRTKPNLNAAMDIILDREKGTRHERTQWHAIAERYRFLTEDQKPLLKPKAAIKKLVKEYKYQSGPALLKGLKRFKENTQDQFYKDALKTLSWSDEFDKNEY